MGARIRVGILSFAHYHANFWSEVFRDSPLAEFVGIWDHDEARGADAAQRYGVPFWSDLTAPARRSQSHLRGGCHNIPSSYRDDPGRRETRNHEGSRLDLAQRGGAVRVAVAGTGLAVLRGVRWLPSSPFLLPEFPRMEYDVAAG